MISTSSEFKQIIASGNKPYIVSAQITLKDNTVLNVSNNEIASGGFELEDVISDDNSFGALGSAAIGQATLVLNNYTRDFTVYDFQYAKINITVGLQLTSRIETLKKGSFIVDEADYNDTSVTLVMLDYMSLFDRPYSLSSLAYPATLSQIIRDACSVCDVPLQAYDFPHNSFSVANRPTDEALTFRAVIAWVAAIAGCFARMNKDGRLELKWFNTSAISDIDTPNNDRFEFSSLYSQNIAVDDTVITGVDIEVKTLAKEQEQTVQTYSYGRDGYKIKIADNGFITPDNATQIVTWLGTQLVGLTFRKATITHSNNPTIEAGDVGVITDRKSKKYAILISRTNFKIGSPQTIVSASETPTKNTSVRFSKSIQDIIKLKEQIYTEYTDREQSIEDLSDRLAEQSGLYSSTETTQSGTIYYLHDKPSLNESEIVWKMTKEAWGVSTDGGQTWNAGMTVDGDTIVRILTATGINAGWINAGELSVGDLYINATTGVARLGGNAVNIQIGDNIDTAIRETSGTTTRTIMDNANAYGLGWKVNASRFNNSNNGECYYHGYAANGVASDVAGWVVWKGEKTVIPIGCGVNPNATMPYDKLIYSVWRTSDNAYHDVCFNDSTGKWEGNTYSQGTNVRDWIPSARSAWTWNEDTDIVLASYMLPSGEGAIYGAQLFTPPKKYSELPEKAMEYSSSELSDFAETVTAEIDDIKDQLDGVIDTYYYSYAPTLNNIPASEWTTEALKADHEGDLFLDTSTGKSYRFVKDNGVWQWKEIPDTASAQALQLAQTAKDTADGKRRVFIVQPTPPYDTGDLWMQGTDGDILVCTTAKAQGAAFSETDFSKLNKYTDEASVTTIVEEHISEIQVGGRNLLTDTNAPTLNPRDGVAPRYWSNIATLLTNGTGTDMVELTDTPIPQIRYGAKFVCTQTGGQRHELAFYTGVSTGPIASELVSRLKNGETYTMSMWAKSDVAGAVIVMFMQAQSAGSAAEYVEEQFQTIDTANKWIRFKRTFTWRGTADEVRIAYFGYNYNLVGTVYACGFQLERGNIATDWSDYPRTLVSYGGRNLIRNTNEPTLIGDNPWGTAEGVTALPSINTNYYDPPAYSIMTGYGVTRMNWEVVDHGFRTTAIEDGYYPHIRFGSNATAAITKEQGLHGLIPGQTYTFSADYRCKLYTKIKGDGTTSNHYLSAQFFVRRGEATSYTTVEYKYIEYYPFYERGEEKSGRLIFTFTVPEDASVLYLIVRPSNTTAANHQTGDYLELANMKLEKGNTASEWSPAPEDTDKALLDTKKTIQGRNYLLGTGTPIERYSNTTSGNALKMLYSTNAMQTLYDLDFKVGNKVTISFDWELTGVESDAYGSFRIEEYGRTSSSEFAYLGIATTITPSATYLSGHESVTLTLTAATVLIKALNLRMDNVIGSLKISNMKLERGELATPWIAANEDAYTQSNGTNMLRSTNVLARLAAGGWEKGLWRASGGSVGTRTIVDISDDSLPKISKGVRFESTAYSITGAAGLGIGQNGVPNIIPGKTYTMSCYAKGTGVVFMMPGVTAWEYQGVYIDSEEYVRVSMTFTIREVAAYADQTTHKANVFFGATGAGADVTLCGFKMEEGLTATEWCEAPEDAEDAIAGYVSSLKTQIDGKADTYYQPTDPSTSWEDDPANHEGDLWYDTSTESYFRFNGTTWQEVKSNLPSALFDDLDGRATVYTGSTTPSAPQLNDLWFKGTGEPIKVYNGSTWVKLDKYTDDTVALQNVRSADVYYYVSTSPTDLIGGSWSTNAPTWTQGTYIWTKTIWTKGDGTTSESSPTCLAGNDAMSYHLNVSDSAIIKRIDGTYNPSTITLTGRSQTGDSAMQNYTGRFRIETSTDGSTWTLRYTSSDVQTYTYTIPSGIMFIRCSLYKAGGTTVLLDQQTIPVIAEANRPDENFLIDSTTAEVISIGDNPGNSYSVYKAETEYGKSISNNNQTDLFLLSYDWSTTATAGNAWAQIDGNALSNDLIVEVSGNGDQKYRVSISPTVQSGHYEAIFRLTATQAGKSSQRVRIRVENATAGETFTVSNIEFKRYFNGIDGADGSPGQKGDKGDNGADAYTVILTNENHTFAGTETAAIASSTTCNVIAYKGITQVAATIGSITGLPTGMTVSISNNGSTTAYFTVAVTTDMKTKNGVLTVPVTVDGKTFNMKFTYSLALKGEEGVGIAQVTELYYVSSSSTAPAKPTISAYPSGVTTDDSTTSGRGKWNKACAPWSTTYKYFYTCSEILYDDGTRNWTDVSSNKGLENANTNASTAISTANDAKDTADQASETASDAVEKAELAMLYGTSGTAASAQVKVVTCSACTSLAVGRKITVNFTYANTYVSGSVQLNVNSLGVKNIYVSGAVTGTANNFFWAAGATITFLYDGTYWIPIDFPTSISSTSATSASSNTKIVDAPKCVIAKGTHLSVTFSVQNTNSAPNLNVGSTLAKTIKYKSTSVLSKSPFSWKAGSTIDFSFDGQYWQMTNVNVEDFLGYYDEYLDDAEVFKKLTNDGAIQGIFKDETTGDYYINFNYAHGGILKLGGVNDNNGVLEVYNSENSRSYRSGRWDNNGLYIGNIKDNLILPNINISQDGTFTINSTLRYSSATYQFKFLIESSIATGSNIGIKGYLDDVQTFGIYSTPSDNMIAEEHAAVVFPKGVEIWFDTSSLKITKNGLYTRTKMDIESIDSIEGLYLLTINKNVKVNGNLAVTGTKPRLVTTKDYGERYLYCYETPAPSFGDIGEGIIGEDGLCYVYIDSIFAETISISQYQVFLQAYGEGQIYVKERKSSYFVVAGPAGISFGWEIKARQKDFNELRLDKSMGTSDISVTNSIDYGVDAINHINEIKKEREVTNQ